MEESSRAGVECTAVCGVVEPCEADSHIIFLLPSLSLDTDIVESQN